MARIKMAYIGGGSSRAAGTMDSFIGHGKEFFDALKELAHAADAAMRE